jgi:hypothetical protein
MRENLLLEYQIVSDEVNHSEIIEILKNQMKMLRPSMIWINFYKKHYGK